MDLISKKTGMRILFVTAVDQEKDAVLRGIHGDARFDVLAVGIGPVAAAVNTAKVLATATYDLIICAGIAGGFSGKAEVGSLAVATEIIAADLGAETPTGFSSLEDLGLGSSRIKLQDSLVNRVTAAMLAAKIPVSNGPIITVSTVTGTASSAEGMLVRIPDSVAEAMEGYGVAMAAQVWGVPILEIRAISNMVGPRDRDAWRIAEALGILEKASSVLTEVLL